MDAGNNRDLSDRTIVTTRLIEAPRQLVFEAFTDPAHLARWWGPDGFTTTTSHFEFRPGGEWRFVMHGPDGRDYQNRIIFEEIVRPERIVYRHGGGADDMEPVSFTNAITFEDLGGRTRLTMSAAFSSAAERQRVIRDHKADEGGRQTLGRLAQAIEEALFVISRRLKAPRDLVWKMYTEIEHLSQWWGPKGFVWIKGSLELKPGGLFHYGMTGPNGAEMWGRFVFHEIVSPERLVFVNSFSDRHGGLTRAPFAADWPLEVLNTMTLAEEGNETVLTLRGAPLNASEAERARFRSWKPSMNQGFAATFEQLEAYLANLKPSLKGSVE